MTFVAGWLAALLIPTAPAQLPPGFQDNVALSGVSFTDAVAVRFAPDGRVFVAERGGIVKTFSDLSDPTPTVFADLSTQVYNAWDRGLLGLAIHPDFPTVPYVYVFYTYDATIGGTAPLWNDSCPDPPGFTNQGCQVSSRLSRLTASGEVMSGPEVVLREGWCQQFPSHSVGDLAFGQDGALYLTHGDGAHFNFPDYGQVGNVCGDPVNEGGALRCQDLAAPGDPLDYHGCLLRLDPVSGAALPDNPLFGGQADDDPIVAYGLRNPYRFTIRPNTNEIWIGDVGWGGFEEVNRVTDPTDTLVENFGWPCYEGPAVQDGYDALDLPLCEDLYLAGTVSDPYHSYPNQQANGNSITGVAFSPGGSFPSSYDGALFFADFSAGWVRVLLPDANGDPDPQNVQTFALGVTPVDLTFGPDGNLYYVAYNRFGASFVRRFEYFPVNEPPVVVLTADPTSGTAPLLVSFDASGSSDADPNDTISFAWDLDGDGQYDDGTTPTTQYTYTNPGSITARVRVTDNHGAATIGSVLITIDNRPPVPTISLPTPATTWRVGDPLTFAGSALDPDTGPIPPSGLDWQIILHHCQIDEHEHDGDEDPNHHGDPNDPDLSCHEHAIEAFPGVDGGVFNAIDHEYPSFLEIRLTATDDGAPDWWNPAWTHRQRLLLDNSARAETLTDFPLLVRLNASRTDYGLAAPDGADLRFVGPQGQPLDHEIESWNPAGESLIWVRVPTINALSDSDYVWMYLGNPAATDTQNPAGVWSADYAGVWHLGATSAAGDSLLVNGGFEDNGGSLDGWSTFGNTFASTIDPRTGSHHLKMFGQFSGSPNVSLVYQDLPATAGETWELSTYVEHITGDAVSGTANSGVLGIEFYDAGANLLLDAQATVLDAGDPTDTWLARGPLQLTAPANTATARALLFFVQPANESGAIFFDDLSFGTTTAGPDFPDASGNGNDGTNFASQPTGGILGGARSFASGQAIQMNTGPSLALDTAATLQAWIRVADPELVGPARILSKKTPWDGPSGYEMEYDAGANNFTVLGSGGDFGRANPIDLDADWHLLTATMAAGTATMYVDGQPVTTDATVSPLAAGADALWIARHSGGGSSFDGDIDEVRIAGVVRSAAWISAQHQSMTDQFVSYGTPEARSVLSATASVELQPETSVLTLASIPSGLSLVIYSDADVTPFTREAIVFAMTTLSAPGGQVLDGERYEFVNWSNGNAQTHTLTVSESDETLVATFAEGCSAGCDIGANDADVDGDCDVDLADLAIVLASFGSSSATHGDGDANLDGVVDLTDLSMLLARFGITCN